MRPTRARRTMLAFALGAMAVAYLDRICISTAAPAIKADLGLDDAQMGYVFSAFDAGVCALRGAERLARGSLRRTHHADAHRAVVVGDDRSDRRGAGLRVARRAARTLRDGRGRRAAEPDARLLGRWLPVREQGRAFGLTIMAAALGGAATQPLVVAILGRFSWRQAFPIFGAVGLVWAAAWFVWFRDDPRATGASTRPSSRRSERIRRRASIRAVPWGVLLRSRNLMALCAMYFGAIYGWYFYLTWLPTYLLRARGFDLAAVGWLAALPLLGIATGSLAGGLLADALTRRFGARVGLRAPGLVGLPLAALAIAGAVGASEPRTSAFCLAAAAGLAALGVAPAWSVCLAIGGRHAGVVSGAMNTFGNLGGFASPIVVGWCLTWWNSWDTPLYTVAGLYVFAAVCWLGVDPLEPLDVRIQ